ncbi:MAG: FAD-dependent monooxygenase [Minwuia sp.]|uniref:FAD-dependent monooxygenase n=1 Tax=Minwuia sp. TaxID=2493630 RepID=UPI003A8C2958
MLEKTRSLYFDYRPYPFVPPPELAGTTVSHAVAIVGAGPVGLAVALGLARQGIRSVVIEAGDTESAGSRALCISRRSMEILQNLGVGEAFEAMALPWTSGQSFYRGEVIYQLEMPHSAHERYHPMNNLQQNFIERLMLEKAAETGLVEIRWRSELKGLRAGDDGVELDIATPEGDYCLDAGWLVAADGARSTVRSLMGLKLAGMSYSSAYLIADIRMRTNSPTERRAWFDSPVNRGSTILMHKQPKNMWRVDYQLRDEDDEEAELQPDRIRQRISDVLEMAGETAPWELDWYSLYKAHCLCLDSYDHGRVAFVGDAAHLVPIFGVRGLNSGLADADNLAWKLGALVRGAAGPAILESYTPERRAATLEIFREARKSTNYMTPPSRGYRLMRDASLSLSLSQAWAGDLANPRQSAPHDYAGSPHNSWPDEDAAFAAGPRAGAVAASVRLSGGAYLTDRLAGEATALYFTGQAGDTRVLAALDGAATSARPLRVIALDPGREPDAAARYGAVPGTLYLLRPDWHVAARARTAPDAEEIARAAGRIWGDA